MFSAAYYLSPSQEVRDAAAEAKSSLYTVRRQVYLNTQLYQALQFVAQNAESLNSTDTALLQELMQNFELRGIALDENDTARFDPG